MKSSKFARETSVAVQLAGKAAEAAEWVRRRGIRTSRKQDGTPLTQADIVSQAIILSGIARDFPEDRVEAEEALPPGGPSALKTSACEALEELGFQDECQNLERIVNYRGNPRGQRVWMIDPIDGTKGFERGLPYAVAIGLYFGGRPRFGCLAAPLLPTEDGNEGATPIAFGAEGEGAHLLEGHGDRARPIRVSDVCDLPRMRLVGSRAHDLDDICGKFVARAGIHQLIRMDGQVKYLMLASGRADVYIRSADPDYGIAFPWDHCAGQAILHGAGGLVTTIGGRPIDYEPGPGNPITNLEGLVASNGKCHEEILTILRTLA
jgi:3'(2'), 5'-bisphosphate nucleotidase